MTKAPKSAEAIMKAAEAPTAENAMSEAAKTSPRDDGKTGDGNNDGLDARVAALEAEIAYLRELFGWPNKAD